MIWPQGGAPAEILADLDTLHDHLGNDHTLFLGSVLPVNGSKPGRPANRAITGLNSDYAAFCADRPNCIFIDLNAGRGGFGTNLASAFDAGDGVHLNAEGYRVLTDILCNAIKSGGM